MKHLKWLTRLGFKVLGSSGALCDRLIVDRRLENNGFVVLALAVRHSRLFSFPFKHQHLLFCIGYPLVPVVPLIPPSNLFSPSCNLCILFFPSFFFCLYCWFFISSFVLKFFFCKYLFYIFIIDINNWLISFHIFELFFIFYLSAVYF